MPRNDGDQPYAKSSTHGVFAFHDGPDDASDFEVDVDEDRDQHKPQNVMDNELRVQERNWRNIFDVAEERGQHYREYRNDLDDNGSSNDSAVSYYLPLPAK